MIVNHATTQGPFHTSTCPQCPTKFTNYSEYKNLDDSNLYKTVVEVNSQNLVVKEIEPLKKEIELFLESIKYDRVPSVSGEDGLRAVNIVEAGLESLKNEKIIYL